MPEDEVYKNLLPEDTLRVIDYTEDYDMEEELYDDTFEKGDLLESMQLNLLNIKIEKGRGSCAQGHRDLQKSKNPFSKKVLEQGLDAQLCIALVTF